tara:strand:- start:8560 stop:9720 length:1161 start_codon:yes stop_codon:yes gene_type:complete
MDDLLKEAIADAKAVRETALENAKLALEEAFTPRLQSMLSKKIQSEVDAEGMHDEDEDMEERGGMMDDDEDMEERGMEERGDDMEEDDMEERGDEDEKEEGMHDEDEDMDENVIEIDGVKYAPVVSEEEEEDEEDKEEGMHEEEDLDLEAVIKELESEIDESEEIEEGAHEDEEDDEKKEEVEEEVDAPTGIGSADNKMGNADKSSGIGSKDKAKFTEGAHEDDEKEEGAHEDEKEMDEEIDLEEVLKALSEEEEAVEENSKVEKLQAEINEHRNVVKYLRSKLNEVNLLNAKLLFTNKLFRAHGLTNEQKMKVVETFDRASNLREVKLVYSTLAESFGASKGKTEIKESKGSASKAVASTKSKKQEVIAEGHEMRDRFKKLAGIL